MYNTTTFEDVRSHTPNATDNTSTPKKSKNSLLFRKRITMGRTFAFLIGGLFFYLEIRLWELYHSLFWAWTKEQAILWIGLAIGVVVALAVLIGFKGLQKWAVSPRKVICAIITLFVVYQIIISVPHISLVGEWLVNPAILPSPFTGWLISFTSILLAFIKMPKIKKKESE